MAPSGVSNQGKNTLSTLLPTQTQGGSTSSPAIPPTKLPKGLSQEAVRVQISDQGRAAAAAAQQSRSPRQPEATLASPAGTRSAPQTTSRIALQGRGQENTNAANGPERNRRSQAIPPRVVATSTGQNRLAAEPPAPVVPPSRGNEGSTKTSEGTTSQAPVAAASPRRTVTATSPPTIPRPSDNELAQAAINTNQKFATTQVDSMRKSVQGSIFSTIV